MHRGSGRDCRRGRDRLSSCRSPGARPVVLFACLLFPIATTGDVVVIDDGSRVVGKVEKIIDGKVTVSTQFAGRLEIEMSKVTSVSTDEPITVEFESGDRLIGTIEMSPDDDRMVVRSSIGDVPLPSAQKIDTAWQPGEESPEVAAVRKQAEEERKRREPKWTLRLESGFTRREGNTDTREARGRFDVKRKTPKDLLEFWAQATFAEQNDERTENEYKGGVRYENSITERWYWYTRMGLEFDEFENLDLRATASAGAGYYWLKKDEHELKTSGGLGYRHESFDSGDSDDAGIIDLGLDYRRDIAPWVQFVHSTYYSPDFEDFDDYRLNVDTAFIFPLKQEAWKLKLGVTNQYNSRPQPGIDRLDNTYYANVLLELK